MFGLFKKRKPLMDFPVLRCNHDWHYVKDTHITVNVGCVVDAEDGCYIYCPKCEDERLVYKEEWVRIKRKQEIKEQYTSGLSSKN